MIVSKKHFFCIAIFFFGVSLILSPSHLSAAGFVWTQSQSLVKLWRAIDGSDDLTKLIAGGNETYLYTSTDSGVSWTPRANDETRTWYGVTSSSDATKMAAVNNMFGNVYTSANGGVDWTAQANSGERFWAAITSSADGTKIAAADYGMGGGGYIYTSADSGVNWATRTNSGSRTWTAITSSSDGVKLAGSVGSGLIYTSTDSGANWTARGVAAGARAWTDITSSSDGTKLAATVNPGYIYLSTDSGATWATSTAAGSRAWSTITSSSDGTKLAAGVSGGYIYTSLDSGATWTENTSGGSKTWNTITSSADGTKLAVGVYNGAIYVATYDSTNPTPGDITFSNVTQTTITATTTATDASGLAVAPFVYHNVTTDTYTEATSTSVLFTGLTANTAYTYEVGVRDIAGNWATSTTYATTTAKNIWTITASVGANGSITPTGAVSVTEGEDQAFTLTPSAGYSVGTLTIDGGAVATSTTYTFSNVTANHTISATFADVTAPTPGTISFSELTQTSVVATTTATDSVTLAAAPFVYHNITTGTYSEATSTSILFSGLTANTTYTFEVGVKDAAGNWATSTPQTLTTMLLASVPINQPSSISIWNPLASQSSGHLSLTLTSPVPVVGSSVSFIRDLELGVRGSDVKALQQYLNTHGFTLAKTGPGSPGNETTMFGYATRAALIRFQKANAIYPTKGYFGPKTRAFLKGLQ